MSVSKVSTEGATNFELNINSKRNRLTFNMEITLITSPDVVVFEWLTHSSVRFGKFDFHLKHGQVHFSCNILDKY